MLSVTRTLALVKPLYVIRKKIVYLAFGISSLLLLIPIGTKGFVLNLLMNDALAGGYMLGCDDATQNISHILRAIGKVEMCG